jgi:P27 family predicted phage terminase small subunit
MGLRGPLPRHSPKPSATTSPPLPPPAWLPPPAVEVWQEIEPCLRAAGRLRHEHADTLAAWACTAAELRVLSVVIARDGSTATGPHGTHPSAAHSAAVRLRTTLLTLGKALGLDPASSARLEAVGGPADDALDAVREYAAKRDRPRDVDDADAEPMNGTGLTVLDYVKRHRGTA